jgi:hypothetical protein
VIVPRTGLCPFMFFMPILATSASNKNGNLEMVYRFANEKYADYPKVSYGH